MMTHKGTARCAMIIEDGGLSPDLPPHCTYRRIPHGVDDITPTPSGPECIVEFSTEGDMLAEFQAHAGILYIFEYGEI